MYRLQDSLPHMKCKRNGLPYFIPVRSFFLAILYFIICSFSFKDSFQNDQTSAHKSYYPQRQKKGLWWMTSGIVSGIEVGCGVVSGMRGNNLTTALGLLWSSRPLVSSLVWEALSLFGRLEDLEWAHECLIDAHHRPSVVEFTTIIRCRKQSHELPPGKKLIPIFNDLVSTANQI